MVGISSPELHLHIIILAWLLISNVGWVYTVLIVCGPIASINQTFPPHVGLSNLYLLNGLHVVI